MLEKIMAIDVALRIPHFHKEIRRYAKESSTIAHAKEALALSDREQYDAIAISIYQALDEEVLRSLPRIRFIFVLGTSTKLLPVDYCTQCGITIIKVTEYCDRETAEWVMLQAVKFLRDREDPLSVYEKKLGVIGVGAVGHWVVELAECFGMTVYYNTQKSHKEFDDKGIKSASKEEIFASCDIVSFHTPPQLTWLSKDILKHARRDICLINTCMGRLSFEDDLENFLKERDDATLIMDKIAALSYQTLSIRAKVFREPAYETIDSKQRLINKFLKNLEIGTQL